jgi:hypothetical protein
MRKFSLTAGKGESIKIILPIYQYVSEARWATYLHLMSNYQDAVSLRTPSVAMDAVPLSPHSTLAFVKRSASLRALGAPS